MANFILSAEAACDLTKDLAKKYEVNVLPMSFYINGKEFKSDASPFSTVDICLKMQSGATTKTSQPNEEEIKEYLSNLLKQGKDILHLSFSSAMSGTYANFKKIAQELNQTSEHKVYVIDTLCQSGGVGLLLAMLRDKINKENIDIHNAIDFVEKIKLNIVHYFIVEDLKYLSRGGRISSTRAFIGNILRLKPVLHVDKEGKIVALQKVIGRKKSVSVLVDKFKEHYNGMSNKVFICNANCQEDCDYVKAELLKINPNLDITTLPLGTIIVSHAGPGTLALFFTANERK